MTRKPTHADYRRAAQLIWGDAGGFVADEYARLNALHFDGALPPIPFAIGITAYGRCIGLTRGASQAGRPRITIASNQFDRLGGVSDVVLHEMVHLALIERGENTHHEHQPWCDEITRISKTYGSDIVAKPRESKRVGKQVVKVMPEGSISRREAASWPQSLGGFHDDARSLDVDSY